MNDTGKSNEAFENDDADKISDRQVKSNGNLPINKKAIRDDIDPISKGLVYVRSTTYNYLKEHGTATKVVFLVLLNAIVFVYFGFAIYYFVDGASNEPSLDWCNGHGLLIIVYCVFYGLLLYFQVIKRFFGKWIYKNLLKPIVKTYDKLWLKLWFRIILYLIPLVALIVYLVVDTASNRDRLWSFLGVVVFMLFGFIFSKYPGHIRWRPVFWGLALQFIFGLITIRWPTGRDILECVGNQTSTFLSYTNNGTAFVYGHLVTDTSNGTVFAFATLPVIFFFSFCVSILSYYGALQWFVRKLGWFIQVTMGTTVCESVNAAASIFLGQTESPLLIRDYIKDLTKSELHAIMCEGWATIAGTVLAAYISFGVNSSHLITASVMSAPAALCYSKLFYPETEESKNTIDNIVLTKDEANNVLDAACKGAVAGLELVAGIIANIIAFLAFVAFTDGILHYIGFMVGWDFLSFQYILSKVFIPISFLMGVDTESLEDVSILIGTKVVVNEFQAYEIMGQMLAENKLSPRTEAIATYALCGFSNFASIGILIAGLTAIAPNQRGNLTQVAMRAFVAANIVCFLTASIAGTLLDDTFLEDNME